MRLDHLLSKEHNTSTFPGYPEPERGVAEAQHPNVVLLRLLKELWNYWLWSLLVGNASCSTAGLPAWNWEPAPWGVIVHKHTVGS